jgi:hypothetical protein
VTFLHKYLEFYEFQQRRIYWTGEVAEIRDYLALTLVAAGIARWTSCNHVHWKYGACARLFGHVDRHANAEGEWQTS